MEATTAVRPTSTRLLLAAALGAAVALGLGVYGHVHDPSQKLVFTLFFSSTIAMKVWLASVALAFGVVQVTSALWVDGRLPWKPPGAGGAVGAPPWEAAGVGERPPPRLRPPRVPDLPAGGLPLPLVARLPGHD